MGIVMVLGLVMISSILLKICYIIMTTIMMDKSMKEMQLILMNGKISKIHVITTVINPLTNVKCTNVLSILKTIGEISIAQNLNTSIVTVHTDHIDPLLLNRKLRLFYVKYINL